MPVFQHIRVSRAIGLLLQLRPLVPPKVLAALLRTWYGGWCTKRRFQQQGGCHFGCPSGEDSVQHYAACSRLHDFGGRRLHLPVETHPQEITLAFLLLIPTRDMDPEQLKRRALLVTAAYPVDCGIRRGRPYASCEVLDRALEQGLKEAALGHQMA